MKLISEILLNINCYYQTNDLLSLTINQYNKT